MELAAKHNINHSLLVLWVQKFQRGEMTEEQDQAEAGGLGVVRGAGLAMAETERARSGA